MKSDHFDVVGKERQVVLNDAQLQPGKYVACIYENDWFVGCIVDQADENCDVFLSTYFNLSTVMSTS